MMNQRPRGIMFITHIFAVTFKIMALFLPFILVLVTGFIFSDWVYLLADNKNIVSFIPFILFFVTTIFLFNYNFWLGVFYKITDFDPELERMRQEQELREAMHELEIEREKKELEYEIKRMEMDRVRAKLHKEEMIQENEF